MEGNDLTVSRIDKALIDLVEWEKFAIHLKGMDDKDIEEIRRTNHAVAEQKIALYRKWLRRCPNAAWEDVVKALNIAKEYRLEKEVEETYINYTSSSDCSYYGSLDYSSTNTPSPKRKTSRASPTINHDHNPTYHRRQHTSRRTLKKYHRVSLWPSPNDGGAGLTDFKKDSLSQPTTSIVPPPANVAVDYSNKENIRELEESLSKEINEHYETKITSLQRLRRQQRDQETIEALEKENKRLREDLAKMQKEYDSLCITCKVQIKLTETLVTEKQVLQEKLNKHKDLKEQSEERIRRIEEHIKSLRDTVTQL